MRSAMYRAFSPALSTLFGSIDGAAQAGIPVFAGSPGSISIRKNKEGVEFYTHRFYAGDGRQHERYIGKTGDEAAELHVARLQEEIKEVKEMQSEVRTLIREGFQMADPRTYATLAALYHQDMFLAGATLIGSHAFGVLLNQLGVHAVAYTTEDLDVARGGKLAFASPPDLSFLEMLKESGIEFLEVPPMERTNKSTRFKEKGRSRFHVDLLVPSPDREVHTIRVPELKSYACAVPYLAYLLGDTQLSTALSREGCCPVRVPVPERFAVHKMFSAQLRARKEAKKDKDLQQAAVLIAALSERHPGAFEQAIACAPLSALGDFERSAQEVRARLDAHARAQEELDLCVEISRIRRSAPAPSGFQPK